MARFYEELADKLEAGARAALAEAGIADVDRFDVPGAFELPLVAKYAAESGRYEAVVCLGAVIRGETDHYDYVCGEAARGIQQVQLETGVPCGFGVLTVDTMEQALDAGRRRRQARHRPPRRRGGAGVAGGQAGAVGRRGPTGLRAVSASRRRRSARPPCRRCRPVLADRGGPAGGPVPHRRGRCRALRARC